MKLEVGQKLWYVPNDNRGRQREITIERIGRKWAFYERNSRIDIGTLIVDGGKYSSPGKCYLSQKEYQSYVNLRAAWRDLVTDLPLYSLPEGMTQEKIDAIRELVFGGDDD